MEEDLPQLRLTVVQFFLNVTFAISAQISHGNRRSVNAAQRTNLAHRIRPIVPTLELDRKCPLPSQTRAAGDSLQSPPRSKSDSAQAAFFLPPAGVRVGRDLSAD